MDDDLDKRQAGVEEVFLSDMELQRLRLGLVVDLKRDLGRDEGLVRMLAKVENELKRRKVDVRVLCRSSCSGIAVIEWKSAVKMEEDDWQVLQKK